MSQMCRSDPGRSMKVFCTEITIMFSAYSGILDRSVDFSICPSLNYKSLARLLFEQFPE